MNDMYLYARYGETPEQAWSESEGLYICAGHMEDARDRGDHLILVPGHLAVEVRDQGQCELCWEAWVEDLRVYHEKEDSARWESRRLI